MEPSWWWLLEGAWKFVNSNFLTSFAGALAGAWGGAYAVQRIADKARLRKQLVDDIRNCNAGLDIAGSLCNVFVSFKSQHVVGMKRLYDEQRKAVLAHALGVQSGRIPRTRPLNLGGVGYGTLPLITERTDLLETIVMEKLSFTGRPRGLVAGITRDVGYLNTAIERQNAIAEQLATIPNE